MKKILSLITLLVAIATGAWAGPGDANSTYLDISKYSTIDTALGDNVTPNLTNLYDYDSTNDILRVSAYGSTYNTGTQKWVTKTSGSYNKEDWDATGVFAGRAAFSPSSTDGNCLFRLSSTANVTYIVTNCTAIAAYYNTRSRDAYIYLKIYEQNTDGTDKDEPVLAEEVSFTGTNEMHALSTTKTLDKTKVYKAVVSSSANCNFYEIAFTSGEGGSGSSKTELTGEWSAAAPSFNVGGEVTIPTFAVNAGTKGTDYSVAYSLESGTLATVDSSEGITDISTESAGTATVKATVTVINTEDYTMTTTEYNCVISVVQESCAVPTYTVGAYDYDKGGYKVTFACETEGATLKYVLTGENPEDGAQSTYFDGSELTYTEPIYVKGTRVIIQASKDGYTTSYSAKGSRYQTSSAPTGTSPEVIGWNVRGNSTGETNAEHGNRAVTVVSGHFAGKANGISDDNGFKLRLAPNSTASGIDGVNLFMKLDVKTGYKVTKVTFDKIVENTSNGGLTINNIYVDGTALADFEAIDIPKLEEGAKTNVEIDLSSAANGGATSNVVVSFARTNTKTTQYNAITTVTYASTLSLSNTAGKNYGFGGFCASQNFTVSDGTAYKAVVENNAIVLKELGGEIVPANAGVIIVGDKGATATINYTSEDATADITGNQLHGTTVRTLTSTLKGSADKFLTMQKSTSKFTEYTGEYFPANRAYMILSGEIPTSLDIEFESEATAITNLNVTPNANQISVKKYFKNGKLVIESAKGMFNTVGQHVK